MMNASNQIMAIFDLLSVAKMKLRRGPEPAILFDFVNPNCNSDAKKSKEIQLFDPQRVMGSHWK